MLTRAGRVKILDFGLAKRMEVKGQQEQSAEEVSTLTQPGTVLGTVGYMSPEQARGQPVDQRSDIFSFGTILYELISGHRPFTGEIPALVIHAILKSDPPDLPASVGPALSSLILRCLEKEPSRRFQSAADLAFALQTLSSVSGRDNAPPQRPRMRLVAPWWGTVALLAALAVSATWWLSHRTPSPHRQSGPVAAPSSQPPSSQPASSIEKKAGSAVASSTATQVKESPATHSAVSTQRAPVAQPVQEVPADRASANASPALVTSAVQRLVPNPVLAAPIAGTVISTPSVTFTWSAVAGAQDYWLDVGTVPASGNISAGFTGGATSSMVDLSCSLTGQTIYVQVYSKVAGIDLVPGTGSRFRFSTSRPSVTSAVPERDSCSAFREGQQLDRQGKHAEAITAFSEAIRLQPDSAEAHHWICGAYYGLREYEKAVASCNEAIRLKPDLSGAYNNRGLAYWRLGHYDRALDDFRQAARLLPNYATAIRNLGSLYSSRQQYDLALSEYSEAVRLLPNDWTIVRDRGDTFIHLKQYDRAVQDYTEVIRLNPSDANSYNQRAYARDMLGDTAGAAVDRRYARELTESNKK
jgi:Flp pilus assembly protein TadD